MDKIGTRDTNWFQSDSSTLNELTKQIIDDWIEIHFDKPANVNQIVLALRLRNTLLNTVLFYDVMLRSAGIQYVGLVIAAQLPGVI
jgi:fatty-acid desaturase